MALPYLVPPSLDIGIPIHIFGVLVAIGVTVGASVMRRYAVRVGESEADARVVFGWIAVTGLVGAHVLDVVFYRPGVILTDPLELLKVWTSISSYGGFVAGGMGFAWIVWRRGLRPARWADISIVGLLLAFSIGRAGCTVVHDHIGAETHWSMGVDYPREVLAQHGLLPDYASTAPVIRAHNLGMEELLYLIPVNILVLWLAFRRRPPAGTLAVITAALYAPVRFGLECWRLASTDPPYAGLTFAQWCSIGVFAIAVVLGGRLWLHRGTREA